MRYVTNIIILIYLNINLILILLLLHNQKPLHFWRREINKLLLQINQKVEQLHFRHYYNNTNTIITSTAALINYNNY